MDALTTLGQLFAVLCLGCIILFLSSIVIVAASYAGAEDEKPHD